jgi:hypothetical protein
MFQENPKLIIRRGKEMTAEWPIKSDQQVTQRKAAAILQYSTKRIQKRKRDMEFSVHFHESWASMNAVIIIF